MIIYQQLEGWSWPTCGLGGWGGSGRWLLPWWRGGEFLFPLTLCWWAPLDSYWLLLVLLASTLVMLVAPWIHGSNISIQILAFGFAFKWSQEWVIWAMMFRLGARLRTRELFSRWATGSCRESAGVAGELFNLCSTTVKIQSGFTGLLQFLDRLLWVRRSQKELCSTTSPMKISRLAASGPESGQ